MCYIYEPVCKYIERGTAPILDLEISKYIYIHKYIMYVYKFAHTYTYMQVYIVHIYK